MVNFYPVHKRISNLVLATGRSQDFLKEGSFIGKKGGKGGKW